MADRRLSLLLVSPDALVQLGLQAVLNVSDLFQIRTTTATLGATLAEWQSIGPGLLEAGSLSPEDPVVVIVQNQDWGSLLADLLLLGQNPTTPPLRPLLLGTPPSLAAIRQAQALGAQGYCLPTVSPEVLLHLVEVVATTTAWVEDPGAAALPSSFDRTAPFPQPSPDPGPVIPLVQTWLHPLLRSGLTQVQAALDQTPPPQLDPTARPWSTPWLNQRLVAGQWRELQAAQWLLQQSLRATGFTLPPTVAPQSGMESGGVDGGDRPAFALATTWNAIDRRVDPRSPTGQTNPTDPIDLTDSTNPNPRDCPAADGSALNPRVPDRPADRADSAALGPGNGSTPSPTEGSGANRLAGDRAAAESSAFPSAASLTPLDRRLDRFWSPDAVPDPAQVQACVMAQLRECFQHYPLHNTTAIPLEIDILRTEKQRELLLLVLQCWDEQLIVLRRDYPTLDRDLPLLSQWIQDLWQDTLTRFLQPYGDLPLETPTDFSVPWGTPPTLDFDPSFNRLNLVSELLQALNTVDRSVLQSIPQANLIFSALLWGTPVALDGVPYRVSAPEALDRLVLLGQNLMITIANGVIQPLLDRFGHRELIKQTLYRQQLLSTREVERFRNNLSWKYRVVLYWETPRNIYESRHWLWGLDRQGLRRYSIYSPRHPELNNLTRSQKTYTLLLEFRDAIAPRLQALTAWVGSGVVYVLTQVVGRAIGLVGRGILQGIGASWGDRRF
ncbi:MAG: DUF3685 domain-containing protein [Prochlorothrix sp.]